MTRMTAALLILAGCAASEPETGPGPQVLFFITADCPIANSFAPEIRRIIGDYAKRGVGFEIVYTDLTQTLEAAQRHAAEYGYDSLVRLDTGHALSRRHGITVTPEVVVLACDRGRAYRGRIDDRYLAPGQYRLKPTTHELRDALEAVLDGRPVAVAETKAAGCPLTE